VDRPAAVLSNNGLTLDLTTPRVQHHGKEIVLTPTEFSILEMLLRHAGQVVTRHMFCERLWDADWEGATKVIEVHMTRLRKKLDKGDPSLIQTVRGRGYALRATRPLPESALPADLPEHLRFRLHCTPVPPSLHPSPLQAGPAWTNTVSPGRDRHGGK
jgi:DNA-binding winged helix-turn-helix (wHTH) protein